MKQEGIDICIICKNRHMLLLIDCDQYGLLHSDIISFSSVIAISYDVTNFSETHILASVLFHILLKICIDESEDLCI